MIRRHAPARRRIQQELLIGEIIRRQQRAQGLVSHTPTPAQQPIRFSGIAPARGGGVAAGQPQPHRCRIGIHLQQVGPQAIPQHTGMPVQRGDIDALLQGIELGMWEIAISEFVIGCLNLTES